MTDAEDLATARETNRRLNLRAQRLESELAAYRRAVQSWEVIDGRTYVPLRSLGWILKASGKPVPESWELSYQRVERLEREVARLSGAEPFKNGGLPGFSPADQQEDPEDPEGYGDRCCQCDPADKRYTLEVDEGRAFLRHLACGKVPPAYWGDWEEMLVMGALPVTAEWERDCDGSEWHGDRRCDCNSWVVVTPEVRLACPRCGEDVTDYAEDDRVYLTGDDRPYCSGECVVATWRAISSKISLPVTGESLAEFIRDQRVSVVQDAVRRLNWGRLTFDVVVTDAAEHDCKASGSWFDRSVCPEPCGSMHQRCVVCGAAEGGCVNETVGGSSPVGEE